MSSRKVLVIGASGYVGSRIVPALLKKGYLVRAGGRSLEKLNRFAWAKEQNVELFPLDVFDRDSLKKSCRGCWAAYYLVHSMNPGNKSFVFADRKAARNMLLASADSDLKRIIYLGGLGDIRSELSKHLRSRAEVAKILHSGKIPVTTFRAAMIIGTASVSFEILAYLVKRLPILATPKWVNTQAQPIAIRNALGYLVGCLEKEETTGQAYDIGGPDILSYKDLMRIYAEEAKLFKNIIIPLPFLTPHLSSYWINFITPISAALARPLAEGLKNRVVCQDNRIRKVIPQKIISCRQAVRLSLGLETKDSGDLLWDADKFLPPEVKHVGDPSWAGRARKSK